MGADMDHGLYNYSPPVRSERTAKNDLDFGQNALLFIVHGFRPKSENFHFSKKGYHLKEHLKNSRMAQISAP